MKREDLVSICKKYWEDYLYWKDYKKENTHIIPENAIPLIWHGDIEKYNNSNLKVITVSLNPHYDAFIRKNRQFDDYDKIAYFSGKEYFNQELYNEVSDIYDKYFIKNLNWHKDSLFKKYEEILNRIDTSYNNKTYHNSSLHIDMYSALATNPIWRNLHLIDKDLPDELKRIDLFMEFIDILKPDLVIISLEKKIVERELLSNKYKTLKTYKKENGTTNAVLYQGNDYKVLYGRYLNTPFGFANNTEFESMLNDIEKYDFYQ